MDTTEVLFFLFILIVIIILVELLISSSKKSLENSSKHAITSSIKQPAANFNEEKKILCPKCGLPNRKISTLAIYVKKLNAIKHYSCGNGHIYHTDENLQIKIGIHKKANEYMIVDFINKYHQQNKTFKEKIEKLHEEVKKKTTEEYESAKTFDYNDGLCPVCHGRMRSCTSSIENSVYQCEKLHTWHYLYEKDSNNKLVFTGKSKLGGSLSCQIDENMRRAIIKLITPSLMKKFSSGHIPSVDELFP